MSSSTSYERWRRHYAAMIQGKVPPNQDFFVLDENKQVGRGFDLVSPAEETVRIARSIVKKNNKNKNKIKKRGTIKAKSRAKTKQSKTKPPKSRSR
jgi:hypothetical protein